MISPNYLECCYFLDKPHSFLCDMALYQFSNKHEFTITQKKQRQHYCFNYSVASTTPCSLIPKEASPSGRQGESTTLQIRVVPRPFFSRNLHFNPPFFPYLVVLAWAIIFPPIGFSGSFAKTPESGFATTWFVTTTATPNSSASFCSPRRN